MHKIGLHGRHIWTRATGFAQHIFDSLNSKEIQLFITESLESCCKKNEIKIHKYELIKESEYPANLDFFISIGGDGTLLESVTTIGNHQTPIIGVNTGRLGFLSVISESSFTQALHDIMEGNYTMEDRSLICLELENNPFGSTNFGLNDFTIHKSNSSSMITVHTYIDGQYLNSYWSDGLIVSTPTGSTGYSLSCGGPIVYPASNNFIITPVSPHNLTVRPILVSDASIISFEVEGRDQDYLISLDSRSRTVTDEVKMQVKKEHFVARLIRFNRYVFFERIREKLNWGLDMRN